MKWFDCLKISLVLLGFVVSPVVGGDQGPATEAFTFVQVSDPQLGWGYGYDNDVNSLKQAVSHINALKPDLVVICGDMVDNFNDNSVADFKEIISGLTVPCYWAPGNHDVGESGSVSRLTRYRQALGDDYFSFEHKGYTFVFVNTSLWKLYIQGESEKQDAWLRQTLVAARDKNSPVFVVQHYPLYIKDPNEGEDSQNLPPAKRSELLALFENSGVVAVLSGHRHLLLINEYKGIQLVTGETTCRHFDNSPLGFRLWNVDSPTSIRHEFRPLVPEMPTVDFNGDEVIDCADICIMVDHWGEDYVLCDVAPPPFGDGIVDVQDLVLLAEHLFEEYAEIVHIQWLGHSTVKIWTEDCVVYVDPERLTESLHDATLVCVTHTHGDHYSPSDIARVSDPQTQFIGPPDVVQQYGSGQTIAPGQTIEFDFATISGVASYNTNKPNHPKSRNWVGYIIEIGSKRIYVAGDTDLIEEMKALGDIDVAILPAGGTYTMNALEAAEATQYIKPELAIPYHWGRNVGTLSDAETFAQQAACAVKILTVDETISSDNWPKYSPLIAHWKLDEAESSIAHDSAGDNDGTCHGEPTWQPEIGMVDGALEFDGIDDYVSADFVLNPADGPFSVLVWVKGGAPGQAVLSQIGGANWLCADSLEGNLMTELKEHGRGAAILPSQTVITDGNWHRVGFVWDGSSRTLYVDGIAVAEDTQANLEGSENGLYIGAGMAMEPGSFWSGLIDDIRIYNQALTAEDIEALTR